MNFRRSLLFIPSNNPAMLQNADIFEADAVIFDLEDAVLLEEKDSARILLNEYLNCFDLKCEVILRINSYNSPFFIDDLILLQSNKINTILLPKANVEDLKRVDKLLTKFEAENHIKPVNLIALVETTLGILQLEDVAACPRINGIMLGGEDLTSELGVERTEEGIELFYSRSKLALVSKCFNIDGIDTPYTNTLNDDGLVKDCLKAKGFGLTAKACIHPNQVEIVNEQFSPSIMEIRYAQKIMIELDKAKLENKGAFSLDGKMIDEPIIKKNKMILDKAKRYGLL